MFDVAQHVKVKESLSDFSLDKAYSPTSLLPSPLQNYLEYYSFHETLKGIPVDYFIGYRRCSVNGETCRIATHYWRIPEPRGFVFVAHGLFDHVGLYQNLVRYLLSQGYAVIAIDMPGHGISDGEATVIHRFEDYGEIVADTLAFFHSELGGRPVFGVGQSTGAAVLMSVAFSCVKLEVPSPFNRLVFLAPLVQPRRWGLGRLSFRVFGRFVKRLQRDFSVPNSHDVAFSDFLSNHDPLQPRYLDIRWVGALHKWVNNFAAQPQVDTPLLIVQGTADRVVDWQYNITAIEQRFTRTQVNYVEGAMHHLVNEAEPWRQAMFAGIRQFLRSGMVRKGDHQPSEANSVAKSAGK